MANRFHMSIKNLESWIEIFTLLKAFYDSWQSESLWTMAIATFTFQLPAAESIVQMAYVNLLFMQLEVIDH